MTTEFKLPLISEGVESADISAVHVHEGDIIQAGQTVLEVETEKAVAEIPSPQAGRVEKILVKPGQTVKIGELLLTIDESAVSGTAEKAAPPADKGTQSKAPAEPTSSAPTAAASSATPKAHSPQEPPPQASVAAKPAAPPAAEQSSKTAAPPAAPASAKAAVDKAASKPESESGLVATRANVADNGQDAPPAPAGPATRRLARELGVDLHRIPGTGPGGRITTEDVQAFVRSLTAGRSLVVSAPLAAPPLPPFDRFGPTQRRPLSKLARVSATNLAIAWNTIPHVTQHDLADVTELEEARQSYMKTIGQNGPKVTMTAIMVKAVVGALKAFPHFNSSIDLGAGELILKDYFHIGVAVDTEVGLLVPVIRDADHKTVLTIAGELAELSRKARDRKLEMADMQGGTFTISNLGGIGGTAFTPIVNYPEAAILGMSRTQTQVKLTDGKLVERLMLPLSLSYDHRIINGADAARFVVKLSGILSDVFQLLVEC